MCQGQGSACTSDEKSSFWGFFKHDTSFSNLLVIIHLWYSPGVINVNNYRNESFNIIQPFLELFYNTNLLLLDLWPLKYKTQSVGWLIYHTHTHCIEQRLKHSTVHLITHIKSSTHLICLIGWRLFRYPCLNNGYPFINLFLKVPLWKRYPGCLLKVLWRLSFIDIKSIT